MAGDCPNSVPGVQNAGNHADFRKLQRTYIYGRRLDDGEEQYGVKRYDEKDYGSGFGRYSCLTDGLRGRRAEDVVR